MHGPDVPLDTVEEDELGRLWLVHHLAGMLVTGQGQDRRASRLTVGLTGSWGSGKSSVLRFLHEYLSTLANVAVVEFNPWLFQGRDDLLDAFFEEVSAQLGRDGGDQTRSLLRALDKYRNAIEPVIEHGIPGAKTLAKAIPSYRPPSAIAMRRILERKLTKFQGAIIVLIDELDRVETADIRALARLIKAVADLPNISYLVSYDRSRVEAALSDGELNDGAAYLEKIIQIIVPLRPLMSDEVESLLFASLRKAGYDETLGDKELMDELVERLVRLLDTPRDVKRVVSSFAAMEPMVHREVNPIDVLGYAAVCTKAPHIRDQLGADPDSVVNDPADLVRAMRRGREDDPTPENVFGPDVSDTLANLLTFLFPHLRRDSGRETERFGRIQERRNLLTMLFLGDPPFQISRKQIEQFWNQPEPQFVASLRETGKFGDFAGQLYRLWSELPTEGDRAAWRIIASELGRGSNRMRANGRYLATNIRSTLTEFGSRGPAENARAKAVVDALIQDDDYSLVPDLLRYHMFAHGLVSGTPRRDGPVIYDSTETAALLKRETPRYRKFVLSGRWLMESRDTDPLFALEQSGSWDAKLRTTAERQIKKSGKIAEFAALFIAPGWSMQPGTLERFVSEKLLQELVQTAPQPEDEWLALSLARLRRFLAGRDPDRIGHDES